MKPVLFFLPTRDGYYGVIAEFFFFFVPQGFFGYVLTMIPIPPPSLLNFSLTPCDP